MGYRVALFAYANPTCSQFDTIPVCDGRTDTRR